jgi:hypothetical protein
MVQLWHLEVSPDLLGEDGIGLDEILLPFEGLDTRLFAGLPQSGWRVLSEREASSGEGARVELAAPHQDDLEGWVMAGLRQQDGQWIASIHSGPVLARPGQAARRQNLRLIWQVSPAIAIQGQPVHLKVQVLNVGKRPWSNGSGGSQFIADTLEAMAWISDSEGTRLPSRRSLVSAHHDTEIVIQPGKAVMPPVQVMTLDSDRLPAGSYHLEAVLTSLNLRSDVGLLQIVPVHAATRADHPPPERAQLPRAPSAGLASKYYRVPTTVQEAEAWVLSVANFFGEGWDPSRSFARYEPGSRVARLVGTHADLLDRCLVGSRSLLGDQQVHELITTATGRS